MKCLQCQTYICDVILLVESGITGVTDKQQKLSHHHHLPKHTMVVGGVVNAINENNMAPSNNEAFPINTWLIQWLHYTTVVIINQSTMNLTIYT